MPRKSKRKGRKPVPPQEHSAPPESALLKYLQTQPEGVRITYLGKDNKSGIPTSLISAPDEMQKDLRLVELGTSVGKGKRRTSSAATIRRNVQICDLRKQDTKKWSYGALAKKYKMKRQSILSILNDEQKWRALASKLPAE